MASVFATIKRVDPPNAEDLLALSLSIPGDTTGLTIYSAVASIEGVPIKVGDQVELDGPRETCKSARIRGFLIAKRDYRFSSRHAWTSVKRPHRGAAWRR
jgi:hypothetical protein